MTAPSGSNPLTPPVSPQVQYLHKQAEKMSRNSVIAAVALLITSIVFILAPFAVIGLPLFLFLPIAGVGFGVGTVAGLAGYDFARTASNINKFLKDGHQGNGVSKCLKHINQKAYVDMVYKGTVILGHIERKNYDRNGHFAFTF